MKRIKNISPGEILSEEFLIPLNISQRKLADETNIPSGRVSEIIRGTKSITADTALRLSIFFGNSPKFWLGLQADFDIENAYLQRTEEFKQIRNYKKILTA